VVPRQRAHDVAPWVWQLPTHHLGSSVLAVDALTEASGRRLMAVSQSRGVALWDVEQAELVEELSSGLRGLITALHFYLVRS
jgi:hypothetical protein